MLQRTIHVRLGCAALPLLLLLASSPASPPSLLLLGLLAPLPAAAVLFALFASMPDCTSCMRLHRYWKMRGINPACTAPKKQQQQQQQQHTEEAVRPVVVKQYWQHLQQAVGKHEWQLLFTLCVVCEQQHDVQTNSYCCCMSLQHQLCMGQSPSGNAPATA